MVNRQPKQSLTTSRHRTPVPRAGSTGHARMASSGRRWGLWPGRFRQGHSMDLVRQVKEGQLPPHAERRAIREKAGVSLRRLGRAPRPVIQVDPAVRFGRPQVRGIPTDAIADTLYAGESAESVCDEYGLTRHELLVALWYEASGGDYAQNPSWKRWANEVAYPALAGWKPLDVGSVSLPPCRLDQGVPPSDDGVIERTDMAYCIDCDLRMYRGTRHPHPLIPVQVTVTQDA